MKIIVDEMPKEPDDCIFARTNFYERAICKFTNCTICDVSKCKYLKPINDYKVDVYGSPVCGAIVGR